MDRDLVLAADALRRANTEGFHKFVEAFRVYTNAQRDNCIQSPLEHLPVTQGRAQSCAQLLRLFEECHTRAGKLEKK